MEFGHFKVDAFWKGEKCSGHAEYWKCSIVSYRESPRKISKVISKQKGLYQDDSFDVERGRHMH